VCVPSTPSGDPCTHAPAPAGTACGDPSRTACNGPDVCDGSGTCNPNLAPDGTLCGDTGSSCINQDACVSGLCHDNGFVPAGTACGDPSSGPCDAPDACDGAGGCFANHTPDGTACDDGNVCTAGTTCTTGVCGGGSVVLPPPVNDSVGYDITGTKLFWSDGTGPFSVYRGKRFDGVAWAYNQTCFDSHNVLNRTIDTDTPAIGETFFYLVTRYDACGESIPGSDSDGNPNPNPLPCP
jgi:hypothetical protein